MNSLTLRALRADGYQLEIECVRRGAVERRSAAGLDAGPATAIELLGLTLTCRLSGARACIVSPAGVRPGE